MKARRPRRGADGLFPIVGIGASAGGLEALQQLLARVPPDCGMAFVVVQHLDPTQKDMLPELLQRSTDMPVQQARSRMKVQAGHVYVIPPNRDMSILHGVLHLLDPVEPRGMRLPIDFFFRALAEDRLQLAVGVILSGMGSDGTLGLRGIKEKAGLTLVQEPASARFDSMPRSAIAAGLADIVAPPEELASRIAAFFRRQGSVRGSEGRHDDVVHADMEKVILLMRTRTGRDFSQYKRNGLYRRIERRMNIHQISRIADYIRYVRENPAELDLLFKELLIGVTSFFRDPAAWACLSEKILPAWLAAYPQGKVIRAWVVGCSTGEEAYSLAIAFKEAFARFDTARPFSMQIFATDLDADAIEKARLGLYPANIAADVSSERLSRFFVKDDSGYRICTEIRAMVTFATQDVILDPPFTKLDILTCRNLLIYFSAELQKKLLPLFHYSLEPDGILFLGSSETIGEHTDLFAPLDNKLRLYRRRERPLRATPIDFPTGGLPIPRKAADEATAGRPAANLQALADQLLLQRFSPPAVLVNERGDLVFIHGRTGHYLELAAGKANWNIHAMAREGLRHELASALRKAVRDKRDVKLKGVPVGSDDGRRTVDVIVHPIEEPAELKGMVMILFFDVEAPASAKPDRSRHALSRHTAELEEALRHAQEENRAIRENMQTTQEELKSANEELQSTNEELQSTNEELTTSKEEMQSMNEELQTINVELQSRVDDLSRASNDMKNLLDSTDIAIVFLDNELHVRRFTTQAIQIFKLIPGDVGRPLGDIVTNLAYKDLLRDAQDVLRTLVFSEKEIATADDRWFKVRIMPYRTLDNVIDGVVITFSNITAAKQLEAKLRLTGD